MNITTALHLAASITYRPDWKVEFHDPSVMGLIALFHPDAERAPDGARFMLINMSYLAIDTDELGKGLPIERMRKRDSGSNRLIRIDDLTAADAFYARVFSYILAAEIHESREFFRINGHAEYHPHNVPGERAWRHDVAPVALQVTSQGVTLPEDEESHAARYSRIAASMR